MATINKLTNANLYILGTSHLGKLKDIELPKIAQKMVDHEALGMIGDIELPSGIEKLEGKAVWASYYADIMALVADPTKALECQVRGNLEKHTSAGLSEEVPVVVYMTVRFKELPGGTFKQHANVEVESAYSAYYFKMDIDGEEILEYDPMSNIYKVKGVDIKAKYRQNLGI